MSKFNYENPPKAKKIYRITLIDKQEITAQAVYKILTALNGPGGKPWNEENSEFASLTSFSEKCLKKGIEIEGVFYAPTSIFSIMEDSRSEKITISCDGVRYDSDCGSHSFSSSTPLDYTQGKDVPTLHYPYAQYDDAALERTYKDNPHGVFSERQRRREKRSTI